MLIKILKLIQILTDRFNLGCTKLQFFLEINSLGGAFFDKAAFFVARMRRVGDNNGILQLGDGVVQPILA